MRHAPASRPRPTFHRHALCDGCHEPTKYPETPIPGMKLCAGCATRLRARARQQRQTEAARHKIDPAILACQRNREAAQGAKGARRA